MIVHTDKHKIPFLIDSQYYESVARYCWSISKTGGYPCANRGKRPNGATIYLHNFLFGYAPDGKEWDHINRNPLDNRRANLRIVTHQKNMMNQKIRRDNTSGTPGVGWSKCNKKWMTRHGKRYIGIFDSIEEAIAARHREELK